MRLATVLALVGVLALLVGAAVLGLGFGSGGDLTERWVSDTARDTTNNHHPIGVGPEGEVVVAPVATVGDDLTNTSCTLARLDRESGGVRWRAPIDPERCFLHSITGPTIGDVTGDGGMEVVVANAENELLAYAAEGGNREFSVPLDTYGYSPPTIGDLPGTDSAIVASDISGNLVVVGGNGTVRWRRSMNTSVFVSPRIGDFDADGEPEIFVAGNDHTRLYSATGEIEWEAPVEAVTLAVGNVDGDPVIEAFATERNEVVALDGVAGDTEWNVTLDSSGYARVVEDADGDGDAELLVGAVNGQVVAIDAATGDAEWSSAVVGGDDVGLRAPVVGDADGDGSSEVVAAATDGTVVVLASSDGSELASYQREVPVWIYPTLGDVDDDGAVEVLVRYGDGRVAALDRTE